MEIKLPKHWRSVLLKEIVVYKKGKKPSNLSRLPFPNSLPYLDIQAIEKSIISKYADEFSSVIVTQKDLLIVWDGSRSGWVGRSKDGALGSTLMAITPILINQIYLYYFLSLRFDYLNKNTTGVGIPHVDSSLFWNLIVPLPPLREQNKITRILESIFIELDSFEKRLVAIPNLIKRYRELILEKAVRGELTNDWKKERNSSWKKMSGSDVFSFITSGSRGWAKYYDEKGSLFLRITNLNFDSIDIDISPAKLKFVNLPKSVEGKRTLVQENDILISITADTGMIGIIPPNFPKAYVNQHIALTRPKENIFPKYLGIYLRSSKGQQQFKEKQKGTVKSGLSLQDIKALDFEIPLSYLEQQEIVKRTEKLLEKAKKIDTYYKGILKYFVHIKKTILEKAFSGELVKKEINELSVSKLIAKIASEREKLEIEKINSRKKRRKKEKMEKSILSIYEILLNNGEMSAGEVWKKSRHSDDIENFYKELREEMEIKKRVKESKIKSGESSLLSIKK